MKRKTLRICYLVLECLLESHETAKLRKITHLAVFFLPHRGLSVQYFQNKVLYCIKIFWHEKNSFPFMSSAACSRSIMHA